MGCFHVPVSPHSYTHPRSVTTLPSCLSTRPKVPSPSPDTPGSMVLRDLTLICSLSSVQSTMGSNHGVIPALLSDGMVTPSPSNVRLKQGRMARLWDALAPMQLTAAPPAHGIHPNSIVVSSQRSVIRIMWETFYPSRVGCLLILPHDPFRIPQHPTWAWIKYHKLIQTHRVSGACLWVWKTSGSWNSLRRLLTPCCTYMTM